MTWRKSLLCIPVIESVESVRGATGTGLRRPNKGVSALWSVWEAPRQGSLIQALSA